MLFPKPGHKKKQKRNREEDISYLKWITEHNCIVPVCGAYPSQAHHAIHKSALGSDYSAVPLCFKCHSLYHMKYGSVNAFEKEFGVNLIKESERLYAIYKELNIFKV